MSLPHLKVWKKCHYVWFHYAPPAHHILQKDPPSVSCHSYWGRRQTTPLECSRSSWATSSSRCVGPRHHIACRQVQQNPLALHSNQWVVLRVFTLNHYKSSTKSWCSSAAYQSASSIFSIKKRKAMDWNIKKNTFQILYFKRCDPVLSEAEGSWWHR